VIDETLLKNEEKAIFALRNLYKKYGYLPFKMSKFEEYDLYVRNKDFLVSDSVITFNDTNGRLLALKPDVTLSIIKNGTDKQGCKQKVYYNENVYRVSGSTRQFKEIMQTGIECIGDIGIYDIFEVVYLAAKSLECVSGDFVLDISHLGILSALLDVASPDKNAKYEIMRSFKEKSEHETENICRKYAIDEKNTKMLVSLIGMYGDIDTTIKNLENICVDKESKSALDELKTLCSLLKDTSVYDKIRLDFSIVNDMNYYNGIVFNGFLNGICESALFGGQYDMLMQRMDRKSGGIGFALYLDLLEGLGDKKSNSFVDVLLLYSDKDSTESVKKCVDDIVKSGKSVSAQKSVPDGLRYKELIYVSKEDN
jgi:ATP phosphoribosyltransferase regulatory subunit